MIIYNNNNKNNNKHIISDNYTLQLPHSSFITLTQPTHVTARTWSSGKN